MPGHIYFVLGEYEMAEKSFRSSTHVDERYMRDQQVAPDDDWNYIHNLMYAVANFMEEGKLKNATAMSSRKLPGARGRLESTLYTYQPRDSISPDQPGVTSCTAYRGLGCRPIASVAELHFEPTAKSAVPRSRITMFRNRYAGI